LLDRRYRAPISGYSFDVIASGSDYTATATPLSRNTGRYGFTSAADSVIRYQSSTSNMCTPCFPPGQAGAPVD